MSITASLIFGSLSNICCYQLDRNKIEGELLRVNLQNPNLFFEAGIANLDVSLASGSTPHTVTFEVDQRKNEVQTTWVVDTTGRSKFLARRLELTKANPIRHGSVFFWADGLLNIEKLTELSRQRDAAPSQQTQAGPHTCMAGNQSFLR